LRDSIFVRINVRQVSKSVSRSDRKLRRIVQSWIKEPADTAHLQRRDKRVPITDSSPRSGPRMLIEARESKCVWNQRRARNIRSRNDTISHLLRIECLTIK